jgi:hypothetical protein
MALQTSGPISLKDIQVEMGGADPIGIDEYYNGGAYTPDSNTKVPIGPAGVKISLADFYGAASEIKAYITSNTNNVNVSTYFGSDWNKTIPKRLIINSGVVVGSASNSSYALNIPSGFSGKLTIENNGSIQGAGGPANGGNGGNAIFAGGPNIRIINNGNIWAGGGGGARGGDGGGGSYVSSVYNPKTCYNTKVVSGVRYNVIRGGSQISAYWSLGNTGRFGYLNCSGRGSATITLTCTIDDRSDRDGTSFDGFFCDTDGIDISFSFRSTTSAQNFTGSGPFRAGTYTWDAWGLKKDARTDGGSIWFRDNQGDDANTRIYVSGIAQNDFVEEIPYSDIVPDYNSPYECGSYVDTTTYTSGGQGGAGGVGEGYNQSRTDGSSGSAGGTNAGSGGNGGNGATWGNSGTNGTNGTGGNNGGGGSAGSPGSGGYYIVNNSNVSWTVTGSRIGNVG